MLNDQHCHCSIKQQSFIHFYFQVIFVPDKDYVHVGPAIVKEPDKPTSPTKVESPVEKPTMVRQLFIE